MSLFCWWGRRNNQSTNVIYDTTELIYKENFENRLFHFFFGRGGGAQSTSWGVVSRTRGEDISGEDEW